MKKIIAIGNSPDVVKAIETIRQNDQESEIFLFLNEGCYPYRSDLFASFLAKDIPGKDLFYPSKNFFTTQKINVILDQKVSRINLKRKRVYTENKEQFEFDALILSDVPEHKLPDIKGNNKTGIYGLQRIKDIEKINELIPLTDSVTIQSDQISGLKIASALAKREKEILYVCSSKNILDPLFQEDVINKFFTPLEEKGFRIFTQNEIIEILGDADAKAIRLKSGKVLATSMILFGEGHEDLRVFSELPLTRNGKVCIDKDFKSSFSDVFAVGRLSVSETDEWRRSEDDFDILQNSGKKLGELYQGVEGEEDKPALREEIIDIFDVKIHVLGDNALSEECEIEKRFICDDNGYQTLYFSQNNLIGAIVINASERMDVFRRFIVEKTDLSHKKEMLFESQLDFDRISAGIQTEHRLEEASIDAPSKKFVNVSTPNMLPDQEESDLLTDY